MAKALKSPTEHRSFADHAEIAADEATRSDIRLAVENPRDRPGEEADVKQGRFGNLNQNLTAIRHVQDH